MIITGNAADVAAAYVIARSEMETLVAQNGTGVYGKYMELGDILKMVTPILAQNGLVVTQEPMTTEEGVGVATTILHSSGARIEFVPLVIPLTDRKPHATGSALSYAKRYALAAVFGLAGDDDDGQAAQDSYKPKPAQKPVPVINGDELFEKSTPSGLPPLGAKQPDTLSPAQLTKIHVLGKEVHGEEWANYGPGMVDDASHGRVKSSKDLSRTEASVLINNLELKLKAKQPHANGIAA